MKFVVFLLLLLISLSGLNIYATMSSQDPKQKTHNNNLGKIYKAEKKNYLELCQYIYQSNLEKIVTCQVNQAESKEQLDKLLKENVPIKGKEVEVKFTEEKIIDCVQTFFAPKYSTYDYERLYPCVYNSFKTLYLNQARPKEIELINNQ